MTTTRNSRPIPPPPSMRRTTPVHAYRPDQDVAKVKHDPWAFPADVGILRNNQGAHGGVKEAGRNDAAKKRRLIEHARQEGRYTR